MGQRLRRKPVPWEFTDLDNNKMWVWNTSYFEASILSQGSDVSRQIFVWKIIDYSTRQKRLFDSGEEGSFKDAADAILEMIGKSYPRELGFMEYAGDLATTFTIRDRRKIDFWEAVGEDVVIFYQEDSYVKMVNGVLNLNHHNFAVKTSNGMVQIPPHLVLFLELDSFVGDFFAAHTVSEPYDYKPVPSSLIRKKYAHDSAILREKEESKHVQDDQRSEMEQLIDETISLIPLDEPEPETTATPEQPRRVSTPEPKKETQPEPVQEEQEETEPFSFDEDTPTIDLDFGEDDEDDTPSEPQRKTRIQFPKF